MDLVNALISRTARLNRRAATYLDWRTRLHRGEHELILAHRLTQPGTAAVDIGANRGLFTSLMATRVRASGVVHSFEPNPLAFALLTRSVSRRSNVVLHNIGLSDNAGLAQLHVPLTEDGLVHALGSLDKPTEVSLSYPITLATLDDALVNERRPISFIKIDVEGHEQRIVAGGHEILKLHRPALLIEIEQRHLQPPSEVADIVTRIVMLGYEPFLVGDSALLPYSHFDLQRDQLDHLIECPHLRQRLPGYLNNFLFLPS